MWLRRNTKVLDSFPPQKREVLCNQVTQYSGSLTFSPFIMTNANDVTTIWGKKLWIAHNCTCSQQRVWIAGHALPPETEWLRQLLNVFVYSEGSSKTIKICPDQHADLLSPGTSFQAIFTWTGQISLTNCLLPMLFSKMWYVLHAGAFDDSMTCQYLKVENLIISRTKRTYEVKSFFTSEDVFHKCPLLDLQNKLAKM